MTEPKQVTKDAGPAIDSATAALLAAIVESSDDAIVSKTLAGEIRSWNAGATRIFGYVPHEIIGRSITTIIPVELHAEEKEIIRKVSRGERIEHFDTVRVAKDGRRIPVSLTVSPVRDAQGTIVGASKVARDISERLRSEDERRQADQRKDEFLALLAHELRNPLAPIRYALELIGKHRLTDAQQSAARATIERQVTHMSRLLDDLLDVARITRGKVEIRKQSLELSSVLATAIETARPALDAKRHKLKVEVATTPVWLEADAVRLAQVFSNLLINAAKFTNPGGNLRISSVIGNREVTVTVHDDGIGISPEIIPSLFRMFSQAPGRANAGLGVGLCLARGLVGLHGGTIDAYSAGLGYGSDFVVRLPIVQNVDAELTQEPSALKASRPGLRVLVVDDNRDAADCCTVLLELAGHTVKTAYTAAQALELGDQFHPAVVLLDIGLPDLDGYEVARRMRHTVWGARSVLVAVTGWGQFKDRQRALEAGFDRHALKPIAAESLEMLLSPVALITGPQDSFSPA